MNKLNKFWNWRNQSAEADPEEPRILELYGTIASESWFDDDVTPQLFREELFAGDGDVVIFLNSPGGDCIAASQIYTMLMEYSGSVTVKIDGIAASAASVIAMAGTEILMAPTSLMMIHNPMTLAFGSREDMEKAIDMLNEVKESIINAYELKTGLSRARISHMMDAETWMNGKRAVELGFADAVMYEEAITAEMPAFDFSERAVETALINKITAKVQQETPAYIPEPLSASNTVTEPEIHEESPALLQITILPEITDTIQPVPENKQGRSFSELMERLFLLSN